MSRSVVWCRLEVEIGVERKEEERRRRRPVEGRSGLIGRENADKRNAAEIAEKKNNCVPARKGGELSRKGT